MTASWATGPFLALDCETTGIDPTVDRIVELAVAEVAPDGHVVGRLATVVDSGVPIPDDAAAVHGITTERAKNEGVPTAVALREVAKWLYHNGLRQPICMFNARFDWPLVLCEADRHGVDVPCVVPVLDPYLIDRMADRHRRGKRRLEAVAEHYGVPLGEQAHGALADAVAAARVMRAILARFPELGSLTLAQLWLRQVRGHEDDRQRLVDWKRRHADPGFHADPGWPVPILGAGP